MDMSIGTAGLTVIGAVRCGSTGDVRGWCIQPLCSEIQPRRSTQLSLTEMLTMIRASAPAASSGSGGAARQAGSARREKPSSPAVQGSTHTKGAARGA